MIFTKLLPCDSWANQSLLHCLQEPKHNEAIRLMAHIVGAQYVWLGRTEKKPVSNEHIRPTWHLAATRNHLVETALRWHACLASQGDTEALRTYQNFKGRNFETSVNDIFTDVICHGAHGRGQVT